MLSGDEKADFFFEKSLKSVQNQCFFDKFLRKIIKSGKKSPNFGAKTHPECKKYDFFQLF